MRPRSSGSGRLRLRLWLRLRLPLLPPAMGRSLPAAVSNHRGMPARLSDLMVISCIRDHPEGGGLVELKPLCPTDVLYQLAGKLVTPGGELAAHCQRLGWPTLVEPAHLAKALHRHEERPLAALDFKVTFCINSWSRYIYREVCTLKNFFLKILL